MRSIAEGFICDCEGFLALAVLVWCNGDEILLEEPGDRELKSRGDN
jgi:hypothetical protein